jgi:UMF1 family MFS transporter
MLASGEEAGIERRAPLGWAIFDVANLMFYMNILSLYFPLWVTNDMNGKDGDYGIANSLSMALIFCTAPLLGALTDQAGRRKPFLVVTTIGCAIATALLGTGGLIVSLGIFVVANFFFQAGSMFYDTLLPSVSTPLNRGSPRIDRRVEPGAW